MKLLHITFHKGCELDIEYAFTTIGHEIQTMYFNDGETEGGELYKITHDRAQKCWNKHKDYFDTFDGIITSDTCPTCRPFLQNNWSKLLIIWVCNRFYYETYQIVKMCLFLDILVLKINILIMFDV